MHTPYVPSRHTIKQRVERAEMKHPSSHTNVSIHQSTRLVVYVGMYMYKCMLELVSMYIYIYDAITDFDYSLTNSSTTPIPAIPTHLPHLHVYIEQVCTYSHICTVLYILSKKARLTIRPASSAHM